MALTSQIKCQVTIVPPRRVSKGLHYEADDVSSRTFGSFWTTGGAKFTDEHVLCTSMILWSVSKPQGPLAFSDIGYR